jgi:hypothetical protein
MPKDDDAPEAGLAALIMIMLSTMPGFEFELTDELRDAFPFDEYQIHTERSQGVVRYQLVSQVVHH